MRLSEMFTLNIPDARTGQSRGHGDLPLQNDDTTMPQKGYMYQARGNTPSTTHASFNSRFKDKQSPQNIP